MIFFVNILQSLNFTKKSIYLKTVDTRGLNLRLSRSKIERGIKKRNNIRGVPFKITKLASTSAITESYTVGYIFIRYSIFENMNVKNFSHDSQIVSICV